MLRVPPGCRRVGQSGLDLAMALPNDNLILLLSGLNVIIYPDFCKLDIGQWKGKFGRTVIAQEIITEIENLPVEKQEVLKFVKSLHPSETEGNLKTEQKEPLVDVRGLWADLDINFTEEDLREARREMWANFPRDIEL